MNLRVISLCLVLVSAWMTPIVSAQTSTSSIYLQAKVFDVILPTCKSMFPHKKMTYSSHLQRWKSQYKKAINKAEEDMINLATMLGQSEALLTKQKVESARAAFQQSSIDEKTIACAKIEAL